MGVWDCIKWDDFSHFRSPLEKKIEIKKYDTEQQKSAKGDQLPVCEVSEKRLQEEKVLRHVPKNNNQINNGTRGIQKQLPDDGPVTAN